MQKVFGDTHLFFQMNERRDSDLQRSSSIFLHNITDSVTSKVYTNFQSGASQREVGFIVELTSGMMSVSTRDTGGATLHRVTSSDFFATTDQDNNIAGDATKQWRMDKSSGVGRANTLYFAGICLSFFEDQNPFSHSGSLC